MTDVVRDHRFTTVPVAHGVYGLHQWEASEFAHGDGTLVLLHGFTGSGLVWQRAVEHLRGRVRVLAPDLAGHGATRIDECSEGFSFDGAVAALTRILDDAGVERCVLHGYSMGGRLALYFAMVQPDRVTALSIESASAGLDDASERAARIAADAELARFVLVHGIEAFVERWVRTPVLASLERLPVAERERLRRIRLGNSTTGLAASLRTMGTGSQPYLGDRLGELSMPALVMAGDKDTKFAGIARELARAVPQARFLSVPDCGHTPHLEQPDLWAQAVDAVLATPR